LFSKLTLYLKGLTSMQTRLRDKPSRGKKQLKVSIDIEISDSIHRFRFRICYVAVEIWYALLY
jgi:hypothetical protein